MKRTIQSLKVGDKLKINADCSYSGIKAGDIVTVLATPKSDKTENLKNGVRLTVLSNEVWLSNPRNPVLGAVSVFPSVLNAYKAKLIE